MRLSRLALVSPLALLLASGCAIEDGAALALPGGSPTPSAPASPEAPTPVPATLGASTSSFPEADRAKLDPSLARLYRAATAQPPDTAALEQLQRLIAVEVAPGGIVVGVLVQSASTDAELAAAGLRVTARVGEVVSGSIAPEALPRLAALPGVRRVEASYRLQP